jgi:hypothetical protein
MKDIKEHKGTVVYRAKYSTKNRKYTDERAYFNMDFSKV